MFIICIYCALVISLAESSILDQRQTGDLNVQVDVKDVQIFAMMKGNKEEYVDYDYAYDYSEFTIKPQNRTTPKPFNGTRTTQRTTPANTIQSVTTGTLEKITTDGNIIISTTENSPDFSTTVKNISDNVAISNLAKNSTVTPIRSTTKNCKRGLVLNHKGECQLKMNNTGNALLKLVKLSQRLKLRRNNNP